MIKLQQAKLHLRVDHDDEDAYIQGLVDIATVAAADYLNVEIVQLLLEMPAPVQSAVLLQVADLYVNRERQADTPYYANTTYERLLNPYRAMVV